MPSRHGASVLLASLLTLALTFVQTARVQAGQEAAIEIRLATSEGLGDHLVDGSGVSLYLNVQDQEGSSTCDAACDGLWSLLTVTGDVIVGQGVDLNLLGTAAGTNGEVLLTYGGHPLYRFREEETPGGVAGHGLDDIWFLVSVSGEALPAQATPDGEPDGEDDASGGGAADLDALMAEGQSIYNRVATPTCATCHGAQGEGVSAPALGGSRIVANTPRLVRQILRGGQFMPPFGNQLSDSQVAAVATFVRNSFGNQHGPVTVEEVAEQRR